MIEIESLIRRTWQTRGPLACLLSPVSVLSFTWLRLNDLAYQSGWRQVQKLPVPVVVVGNVVVGGTGKTPIVISLARHFLGSGWKVGVIARGHGVERRQVMEVQPHSTAQEVGDEALLLKIRCNVPVFTGRQRAHAAQALLQAYPDTQIILSDDGLQHHSLHHDIALCVFDDRGLGNGWLLPAGPLREPWPRSVHPLKHAAEGPKQYLIHTGQQPFQNSYQADRQLAPQAVNGTGQTKNLAQFQGQPVQALAAIAQPELFFHALRKQGFTLAKTYALPDHAPLQHWKPTGHEELLCTEKDAVKLWPHMPQAWAIPLECQLPTDLLACLTQDVQRLSSRHGHKTD